MSRRTHVLLESILATGKPKAIFAQYIVGDNPVCSISSNPLVWTLSTKLISYKVVPAPKGNILRIAKRMQKRKSVRASQVPYAIFAPIGKVRLGGHCRNEFPNVILVVWSSSEGLK